MAELFGVFFFVGDKDDPVDIEPFDPVDALADRSVLTALPIDEAQPRAEQIPGPRRGREHPSRLVLRTN